MTAYFWTCELGR